MNLSKIKHEHNKINRSVRNSLKLFLIGFLLVPALFFTSCDRGDDIGGGTVTPAFTLLKDYMMTNQLDLNNILSGPGGAVKFVVGAPKDADLPTFLAKYYIIDIRKNTDFGNGHIEGAHNVAFSDILTEAAKANKPILMVCYSGQTACYGTSLLRLYGYENTQALKWGMSGWNPATAKAWNNQIGSEPANGNPNWTYSSAPAANVYKDPSLSSLSQDGSEILRQRVEAAVAAGFKTASNGDVLASPSSFFVNNYFGADDYASFGHIANAFRIKEDLLLKDNGYLGLNPDAGAKVVNYCYTGQTSAVVTAWLNVLGYDAYSLTYGMNGLYHTNTAWKSNQWGVGTSVPKNLPLIK
jgi:rhodanese-related sulfurtransferase